MQVDLPGCGLGIQANPIQRLGDRIMELMAQSLPFLQGRHLLRILIQLRVFNGDPGLVGQQRHQFQVGLVKTIQPVALHIQNPDHLVLYS